METAKRRNSILRNGIATALSALLLLSTSTVSAEPQSQPFGNDTRTQCSIATSAVRTGLESWSVSVELNGQLAGQASTDIVFVMDAGAGMGTKMGGAYASYTHMDFAKATLKEYAKSIYAMDILNARLAVVSFNDVATVHSPLTANQDELNNAIDKIAVGQDSNMQAGIRSAKEILQSSRAINRVIVLVGNQDPNKFYMPNGYQGYECGYDQDGNHYVLPKIDDIHNGFDYDSPLTLPTLKCVHGQEMNPAMLCAEYEAQLTKEEGDIIYCIGFGASDALEQSLLKITSKTSNEFANISGDTPDVAKLTSIMSTAITIFAQRAASAGVLYLEFPMSEQFDIVTTNVFSSQGSSILKADTNSIGWLPGDVDGKATLRFGIKAKSGVSLADSVPAFKSSAYINYNEDQGPASSAIAPPTINTKAASITLFQVLVNNKGEYVDSTGHVIGLAKAIAQATPLAYTKNGSAELAFPATYSVSAPELTGTDFIAMSYSEELGVNVSKEVAAASIDINLSSTTKHMNVYAIYLYKGPAPTDDASSDGTSASGSSGTAQSGSDSQASSGSVPGAGAGAVSAAGVAPDTGDSSSPILWLSVAAFMMIAAGALLVYGKRAGKLAK